MSPHTTKPPAAPPARPRATAADLARGLAAGIALTALIIGLPIALYLLAATLPIAWPSSITDIITTPDDGSLLLLALIGAGSIAWAVFAVSVAVEAASMARGEPTPSLPGLGLSQRCAASLVAAVAVMIAPANTFAMAAPAQATPAVRAAAVPMRADTATAPHAETSVMPSVDPTGSLVHQPPAAVRVAPRELPTVTVDRHDTLWGLAEKHLGKGTRYPEIYDINRGHRQPDGSSLQDPDLVMPGWILRLPADARHVPAHHHRTTATRATATAATAPRAAPPQTTEAVTPVAQTCVAGNPSAPATPFTLAPAVPTRVPAPSGDAAASDEPTGDDLAPTAPPEPTTTAPTTTGATQPTRTTVERTPIDVVPASAEADLAPVPAPALLIGLGALTFTGLVGELRRRRRRQRATRRPGQRIPMPSGDAAVTESLASSMAAPASADLLDRSLRHLARECEQSGRPLPDARIVRVGAGTVEIDLGQPEDGAVAPFRSIAPDRWVLDPEASLEEDSGAGETGPYPVLVALGVEGDRQVLLNLESVGTLQVSGPRDIVEAVMRALAIDLAVGASAARCFPTYAVCFDDLAAVLDPARTRYVPEAAAAERSLARRIADDVAIDRRATRSDHDPADVIVALEQLRLAPGPYSGAVLVTPTHQVTGTALVVDDDGFGRLAGGPLMAVQQLAHAAWSNLITLLATAEQPPIPLSEEHSPSQETERLAVVRALQPPDTQDRPEFDEEGGQGVAQTRPILTRAVWDSGASADADEEAQNAPRVLLLGPVTITGAKTPTKRERQRRLMELIAFLALNPGVYAHEIDEAIWPGIRVERTTRNTTIHRARTWLGEDASGEPYLPKLRDRELTYELRPEVTCDWMDFQRLARGGLAKGTAGLADLDEALSLVRGRPFFGVDPATYTWAEPLIQEMIGAVSDIAHLSSTTHLDAGDARAALRAAALGLNVDESSEALHAVAMRAAGVAGDVHSLERFQAQLTGIRALDDW